MKRVFGGLVAAFFLLGVFGPLKLTHAQTAPVDESIWNQNISIENLGEVSNQIAQNGINCNISEINTLEILGGVSLNSENSPVFDPLTKSKSAAINSCVTQNQHGYFVGGRYFSGTNPTEMLQIRPSQSQGFSYVAVPNSNAVLTLVSGGGWFGQKMVINYNFPFIGRLGYESRSLIKHDLTWVVTGGNDALKYQNGEDVLTNGQEFSSNGRFMVVRLGNTFVKVDVDTQQMTPFYYRNNVSNIFSMSISNDGRYVATNSNGEVYIHDTLGCENTYQKGFWEKPTTTVFSGCSKTANFYYQLLNYAPGYAVVRKLEFTPNSSQLSLAIGREYRTNAYEWQKLVISSGDYRFTGEGYLAMGDSFSSGEGDLFGGTWYEPGTDEQGNKDTFESRNLCHLSRRSYPYLIAKELGYLSGEADVPTTPDDSGLFHSVACSGAVLNNIIGNQGKLRLIPGNGDDFSTAQNQYSNLYQGLLGRWQPGRLKQLDILDPSVFGGYSSSEFKPEVITLGISGNDAGFGGTIKACTMPGTCKQAVPESIDATNLALRIMKLKPKLVETYSAVKNASPDSRVYVHGYPVFVQGYNGDCDLNVRLDVRETALVELGVKYMNKIVQSAAAEAGVFYVDIENILEGTNLCSGVTDGGRTVNGVTSGNDIDFSLCLLRTGCLGNESYHPNQFGHKLYKERVLQATNNLAYDMPTAQKTNMPVPDSYFGPSAISEASVINSGGDYTLVIPEPKPFLNKNAGNFKVYQEGLLPGSKLTVELQSTPITIAEFTVPASGVVEEYITLPEDSEAGAHEVHLLGESAFGNQIDYYEPIVIAVSDTDFDGDGVLDDVDSCKVIVNSFVDLDQDGIDDVCDLEIDLAANQDDQNNEANEEVINLDGRNLEKGQPNPETVAGNEQLSQVLGASSSSNQQSVQGSSETLANTGIPAATNVIAGILILSFTVLLFRLDRSN